MVKDPVKSSVLRFCLLIVVDSSSGKVDINQPMDASYMHMYHETIFVAEFMVSDTFIIARISFLLVKPLSMCRTIDCREPNFVRE